jgi:hypothetical protein
MLLYIPEIEAAVERVFKDMTRNLNKLNQERKIWQEFHKLASLAAQERVYTHIHHISISPREKNNVHIFKTSARQ